MSVLGAALSRGASFDDRVEALFRPPLGEVMALSPDGQRVAYTTGAGRDLAIVIMHLEGTGAKRKVFVDPNRGEVFAQEQPPVQLRFLRWATNSRLVYAPTERVVPLPPIMDRKGRTAPNPDGPTIVAPVLVVDLDGKERGTLIDASYFQETPADVRKTAADLLRTTRELVATRNEPVRWRMPHLDLLGFLPRERDQLVVQTRGAYSAPAQHLVDIRSGSVREFDGGWPTPPGEPLVFDFHRLKVVGERKEAARPTTVWRDEEFARVQGELETKFPRRAVELLDWTDTRARVLFRVTGGSDAGRVFVFQRPEDLVVEILPCAPWLAAGKLNDTRFFEFDAADGARLSGYVTWPGRAPGGPVPVLLVFPSGFPGCAQRAFDPEAQAFADLGFAVVRLNHRGVAGVRPQDLDALRRAVDRVSVGDACAAIEWVAARFPERALDRGRVATLGRGFGGYLAVRALQMHPRVFRSGIAIDAPMELRSWLRAPRGGSPAAAREIPAALIDCPEADWKKLSVLEQAEALTNPMLFVFEPKRDAAVDASMDQLRTRLQALGRPVEHHELDAGFAAVRPSSRAAVYRRIEEFLNGPGKALTAKVGALDKVE